MSLDPTDVEEKKVETKRKIDWGGTIKVFEETEGDVRKDAEPNSIGTKVLKALDLIEQAYQRGEPDLLWKECRKQASAKPLRTLVNKKRDYACSDVLKELLLWGRHDLENNDHLEDAAQMGLTKVLELFPECIEDSNLVWYAMCGKQVKTLEFILRTRKKKLSADWIGMTLFNYMPDVDCALLLLNETSPDEYRYLENSGTFQELARQAYQKGSLPLLKFLVDRGMPFHYFLLEFSDTNLFRVDVLQFVLERCRPQHHWHLGDLLHRAFEIGACHTVIDLLWSHGARFLSYRLASFGIDKLRTQLQYARSNGQEIEWNVVVEGVVKNGNDRQSIAILKLLQDEFGVDVQGLLQGAFVAPNDNDGEIAQDWRQLHRLVALKLKHRLSQAEASQQKKRRLE